MAWPEFQKDDSGRVRTNGWKVKRLNRGMRNDAGHGDGHDGVDISNTGKGRIDSSWCQVKCQGCKKGRNQFPFSLGCGAKIQDKKP